MTMTVVRPLRRTEMPAAPVLFGFTQQQRTKVWLIASLRDRIALPAHPWAWSSPALAATLGVTEDVVTLFDAWHRYSMTTHPSRMPLERPRHRLALNGHFLAVLDEHGVIVEQLPYGGHPTEAQLLGWALYRAVEARVLVHDDVLRLTDRVLARESGVPSVAELALEVAAHEDAS